MVMMMKGRTGSVLQDIELDSESAKLQPVMPLKESPSHIRHKQHDIKSIHNPGSLVSGLTFIPFSLGLGQYEVPDMSPSNTARLNHLPNG